MEPTPGSGVSSADSPTAPAFSSYAHEADLRDLAESRGESTTVGSRDSSSPAGGASASPDAAAEAAAPSDATSGDVSKPAPKARNLETRSKDVSDEVARLQEQIRLRKALREELAALGGPSSSAKPQDSQPAPKANQEPPAWERYLADPNAPREEDFDDYRKFVAAMSSFAVKRALEDHERRQALDRDSQRRMSEIDQSYKTFKSRVDEAQKSDPEFEHKIDPGLMGIIPSSALLPHEQIRPANALLQHVVESEAAPALLLHFSTPSGQQDWSNLAAAPTPAAMARAFGRIEARFLTDGSPAPASKPAAKPITSAPEPPTALGRRASSPDVAASALAKGDFAGYRAAADAADLAQFRGQ